MSTRTFFLVSAALALPVLMAACAAPQWDARFGDTVRATTASQIIDPAAARNANPVAGIDGRAARAAQARYEASFVQPAPAEKSLTTGVAK